VNQRLAQAPTQQTEGWTDKQSLSTSYGCGSSGMPSSGPNTDGYVSPAVSAALRHADATEYRENRLIVLPATGIH